MKTAFPWRGALAATLLYTAAFLLTIMGHELGHALVSKAVGGQPVLHHASVDNRNEQLSVGREVAIALAGPLLSLFQGLLLLAWARRARGTGNGALFRLYLGVFGLINFLGYLLTGPFVPYGDIGRAEALERVPAWATITLAVLAAAGLHRLITGTAPLFVRFGTGLARQPRGRLMQALVALPWLLGSVLITLLSLPVPTLLSLIYPPMSSMVLGAAYGGAMRLPYPVEEQEQTNQAVSPVLLEHLNPWSALAALVVLGGIYRALVPGIAL